MRTEWDEEEEEVVVVVVMENGCSQSDDGQASTIVLFSLLFVLFFFSALLRFLIPLSCFSCHIAIILSPNDLLFCSSPRNYDEHILS
jgi:hypothetical protein